MVGGTIDAAFDAPLPRLVPISAAPAGSPAPSTVASIRGLPLSGLPPLVPITSSQLAEVARRPAILPSIPLAPVSYSPTHAVRSLPVAPLATALPVAQALPAVVQAMPVPTMPVPAMPLPTMPVPTMPVPTMPVPTMPAPVIAAAPLLPPPLPATTYPPTVLAMPAPVYPSPTPALQPPAPHSQTQVHAAQPVASAPTGKPADTITIGSFNIQVFGESKISKPQVVDVLARVVRGFDIVAIQEVRAKSDSIIPQFVSSINADGSRYQFVIGPRLGRTVSKEQYCFIYDSNRIEVDPSSVGTVANPGDKLHRAPLYARFRVKANPPEAGFSFWMVDIHTDPDEVPQEVDALADVFTAMKSRRPDEDDVILLGDLNAGPPQFGRLKQVPNIGWAVSNATTNTRRNKTYDNIIFDRTTTTEYTGRWGVLDLQNTFGIPLDKALEVSDHNPVWATFHSWETQQTAAAAQPAGVTR